MSKILMTMAEDVTATTSTTFGLKYAVDEHDCLHFAEGFKRLGYDVYFVNWKDLHSGEFVRMYHFNSASYIKPVKLDAIDLAFVYKMEGFYQDLFEFFKMLDNFASNCGRVVNNIGTIKHNINKSYLWQLADLDVSVIPHFSIDEAARRFARGETLVIKPLQGERGNDVFLAHCDGDLKRIAGREAQFFGQQFRPEIRDGEKSLVFLGHEYSHAVIKFPPKGNFEEFRCNESLGGTVAVYNPALDEISFCKKVLATYQNLGYPVHFSRVDILSTEAGPMLLEAELLNPSIYANYSELGEHFGDRLASYFDRLVKENTN